MEIGKEKIELLRDIFKRRGVSLAYLFGSRARGAGGALSDVDIGVVFKDEAADGREDLKRYSQLHGELEKFFVQEVDLVDLAGAGSPLLRHRVVFRGKLLFAGNSGRRREFELRVLQEYEDTRHLRAVQSAIMHRQISAK